MVKISNEFARVAKITQSIPPGLHTFTVLQLTAHIQDSLVNGWEMG